MLRRLFHSIRRSITTKFILTVGLVLLLSISTWAYFNITYQAEKLMKNVMEGTDRLTNTIRLGTHYAMMLNSRDDINQIINNIAKQEEIEYIRIYNKEGQIKFSNHPVELDRITNIKDEACYICHRTAPPITRLELNERTRIFQSPKGYRLLGIISPICNEPGCANGVCHTHPQGKKILGALDVVISLEKTDKEIIKAEKGMIGLAVSIFLVTSAFIVIFMMRFVNRPIKRLIAGTRTIAKGDYNGVIDVNQNDEMGLLAKAFQLMGKEIAAKQTELNRQRNEYQNLFEQVPCLITVQDREYRLLNYNREFAERFDPRERDYCYHAYKGRRDRCEICPVEKTFTDGRSHYAEETGVNKDGTVTHWWVRTSPIRNELGEVAAAMEISLDITQRKNLEEELEKSERKYHEIFNNIPNPVFVLDRDTLEILDCNNNVKTVYGYTEAEVRNTSFLNFFHETERALYQEKLQDVTVLNQVRHTNREGKTLFVNVRISPSEYSGRKVLLITTSDITKRLETEQQLIQASKMATLGEMATGIAHELNQPLSVIKTASSFFMKKIARDEPLEMDMLNSMLAKVDKNVDRATKIIHHMRQFARKSDMRLQRVQVNEVIENACDIFSQQLKVRGIAVKRQLGPDLPRIEADPGRMEQVFINLLLNSRDAIEEKAKNAVASAPTEDTIRIATRLQDNQVVCEICDTGVGIPVGISDKIFEPFYTTKEVGKGTGLGLSISYGIIKESNGSIDVIANAPSGACFIIRFPIPPEEKET